MVICIIIISKWYQLSHRLLWCWCTVADPGGGVLRGPCPPALYKQVIKKIAAKSGHIDFMFLGPPLPGRWIRCWVNKELSDGSVNRPHDVMQSHLLCRCSAQGTCHPCPGNRTLSQEARGDPSRCKHRPSQSLGSLVHQLFPAISLPEHIQRKLGSSFNLR